jgi:hypothetical protein
MAILDEQGGTDMTVAVGFQVVAEDFAEVVGVGKYFLQELFEFGHGLAILGPGY